MAASLPSVLMTTIRNSPATCMNTTKKKKKKRGPIDYFKLDDLRDVPPTIRMILLSSQSYVKFQLKFRTNLS
jgi:hypothetical protein